MLRALFLSVAWLGVALAAQADFVIRQRVESGGDTAFITYKFKGEMGRIDLPNAQGNNTTILVDLQHDLIFNLLPAQKIAYRAPLSRQRDKIANAMRAAGVDVEKLTPTPTGKKQKIGEWEAEEFVLPMGDFNIRMWVARDFPNGYALKAQLARFTKASSGGALNPDSMNVPGMVVKSEGPGPGGLTVTTLVSAREEPVPLAEFQLPADFEERELPFGMGGK